MSPLMLKRGCPSRRRDDDYDVLEDGKVVGRIFKMPAAAPEGRPWMWASGHGGHHIKRAAHGYATTREAAMAHSPRAGPVRSRCGHPRNTRRLRSSGMAGFADAVVGIV